MTEVEWLECRNAAQLLDSLLGSLSAKPPDRKLQLLTCAICRHLWHLLTDKRTRNAVEVAERFADRNASKMELASIHDAAFAAGLRVGETEGEAEYHAAEAVQYLTDGTRTTFAACWILGAATHDDVQETQDTILRDIFGNPFRPATIDPAWLAWNDGTVRKLAQTIYDERELPNGHLDAGRLAILADALEDAGCSNEDILSHCRGPGPHVRGCWVVDLLLDLR